MVESKERKKKKRLNKIKYEIEVNGDTLMLFVIGIRCHFVSGEKWTIYENVEENTNPMK